MVNSNYHGDTCVLPTNTHACLDDAKLEADKLTKIFSTPPIPIIEIAENNGVDVVFTSFGKHDQTVAGVCDFKESRLYVNKNDTMEKQFFTIAHEFGHWVLHKNIFVEDPDRYPVLLRFQKNLQDDPLEQEADHFAANLLVPEHLLKPVKTAPVSKLASIFNVSKTMMELRLKSVKRGG